MNDFEINIKQVILSFWKIRYYVIFFPCIFILLFIAYSYSQKVFPKNILVYYIQFNDTKEGNSTFINDTSTLAVFKELQKKWNINAVELKNSFSVDALSPQTPFIQNKYQIMMRKPGLKPAEIDAIGKQMVKELESANKLSVKISFDYQRFGLSVKQANEILTSLPSMWNRISSNTSIQQFYISPDLKTNINKIQNVNVKALITYENISNAIKTLEKIEATDKRNFLLLSSKGGDNGSEILMKLKLLKTIYLIPYFNSEVKKEASEILFFLNSLKMNKLELEEKLAGIDRTITFLKKDDANEEKIGVMTSNEINADALKMLTELKHNENESNIYLNHITKRSKLENELAKTKREIDEIKSSKNSEGNLAEYMYNEIFDNLKIYNIFINDYKKNFILKDSDRYNPLVKPQLVGQKNIINIRNLVLVGSFGILIGIIYGLILLFILDFKSKTQTNVQSRR